jgi:hypothetical protein
VLNLSKTTSCGRFTVTVVSNAAAQTPVAPEEMARSLNELAELLVNGADAAIALAQQFLPPVRTQTGEEDGSLDFE